MKKKEIKPILSPHGSCARSYRGKLLMLLCFLFMIGPSIVYSQNIDDFRTAAASDGVDLIPFPDLRRDATAIASEVEKRKEEVKSYNFDNFKSRKEKLLEEIKKEKAEIEKVENDIEEFKNKYKDGDASTYYKEIDKRNKTIAEANDKIKALNEDMAKAADTFDRLNNARAGLREFFDDAKSQLSDAQSNPNRHLGSSPSEEDIKSLNNYISVIKSEIEVQERHHKEQEDGAKKTKEEYEKLTQLGL